MEVGLVVELDGNERYYLTDETIQGGNKFYLATKVDENNDFLVETAIFLEEKENDEYFLTEVKRGELFDKLFAIFLINFNNKMAGESGN